MKSIYKNKVFIQFIRECYSITVQIVENEVISTWRMIRHTRLNAFLHHSKLNGTWLPHKLSICTGINGISIAFKTEGKLPRQYNITLNMTGNRNIFLCEENWDARNDEFSGKDHNICAGIFKSNQSTVGIHALKHWVLFQNHYKRRKSSRTTPV